MASSEEYAAWIVKNADKKGTPEFDIVSKAYQQTRAQSAGETAPAPSKPFGQQLNESIADVPRQIGLTARAGLQGLGNIVDLVATPIRAVGNLALPASQQMKPGVGRMLSNSLGLPVPRNSTERVVGDIAETVAGAAAPIAVAGRVAQGTTGVTNAVARSLAAAPAMQLASAASAGGAGGYVKETGGNALSQFIASLAAGVATPLAANKIAQLAGRIGTRTPTYTPDELDVKINSAIAPNGIKVENMAPQVAQGIRDDVAAALKISDDLKPDELRRLADYRLTGLTPTKATLSLKPEDISQQKNLAKQGINSKDAAAQQLGQTENANNREIISGMNKLGSPAPATPAGAGTTISGTLGARDARAQALISSRYSQARAANGRSAELDPEAFVTRANSLIDEALLGDKIPPAVRNILNKKWTDVIKDGKPPAPPVPGAPAPAPATLTVDMAEQFKTSIAGLQRASSDAAERKALGYVRQALDETPLLPGQDIGQEAINAFTRARKLNRSYMQIVEKTPALAAVRDGVEPDKFVNTYITGNGKDSTIAAQQALRSSIKGDPLAVTTVREQIIEHLKSRALGRASDEVGNVSQSNFNKALKDIGDERLAIWFPQKDIDQLKALGRVASYEGVQPKGSAVGNSNTGAVLMSNILDRIAGSALLSKIPAGGLIQQPVQNISIGIGSKRALNAPAAIAADTPASVPTNRLRNMPSAVIGVGAAEQDREEKKRLRDFGK